MRQRSGDVVLLRPEILPISADIHGEMLGHQALKRASISDEFINDNQALFMLPAAVRGAEVKPPCVRKTVEWFLTSRTWPNGCRPRPKPTQNRVMGATCR